MIARVFPTRTKATPDDDLAFYGPPPLVLDLSHITEVHISVLFTWDLKYAEELACQWEQVAPVKIGGPATGRGCIGPIRRVRIYTHRCHKRRFRIYRY